MHAAAASWNVLSVRDLEAQLTATTVVQVPFYARLRPKADSRPDTCYVVASRRGVWTLGSRAGGTRLIKGGNW